MDNIVHQRSPPAILIVDDDADISCALADLLEHEGYRVQCVGTGTDAISQTQQQLFSAVILDLGLPDMDGLAVLETLEHLPTKVPVIVLTAYAMETKRVEALRQGASAYLTKPYDKDELRSVLRRTVGIARTGKMS